MKKLTTSVSPFVMVFAPVLFAVLLSLNFRSNDAGASGELTTHTAVKTASQKVVSAGESTIIRFLLKR